MMRARCYVRHRRRWGGGCNRGNCASGTSIPTPPLLASLLPRLPCPPGAPAVAPVAFSGVWEPLQLWETHPLLLPALPGPPIATRLLGCRSRHFPSPDHYPFTCSLNRRSFPSLLAFPLPRLSCPPGGPAVAPAAFWGDWETVATVGTHPLPFPALPGPPIATRSPIRSTSARSTFTSCSLPPPSSSSDHHDALRC